MDERRNQVAEKHQRSLGNRLGETQFSIRHQKPSRLIPANGFLEWKKSGARKQPFLIRFENQELFSMAGIWESWKNPETSEVIDSCAILTTNANEVVATIHDRMPVIIKPEDYSTWLLPESRQEQIDALLQPYVDTPANIQPVSTRVNNTKNNDPECIVPVLLRDETQD